MNKRLVEFLAITVLFLAGCGYLYSAVTMGNTPFNTSLPPGYFPTIIGVLWVALCIPAMIKAFRKSKQEDEVFRIANPGRMGLIIGGIVAYLLLWQLVDIFYPATFLLLVYLFMILSPKEKRKDKRQILFNIILSFVVTVVIYLLFSILLHIRF